MTIPYGSCGRPEDPEETARIEREKEITRLMAIVPPPFPKDWGDPHNAHRPMILEVTTNSDRRRRFISEREPEHCSYCRRQYEATEASCHGCGAPRLKER